LDLKGVILAAGKGTRMYPFSDHFPKPILPVANKPIMQYQVELMAQMGIKEIMIVIGHLGYEIVRKIGQGDEYGVRITYIEQRDTLGIAHAVGKLERYINTPFLLFLGDIFFVTDSLDIMVQKLEEEKLQCVLATKIEKDIEKIKLNFSVVLDENGLVKRVIEKPKYLSSNIKGCGLYLFDLDIFDAIRRTPRTAMRDEYEITDSIQILIDFGGKVKNINVIETDLNLTFPEDLLELNISELKRRNLDNIIGCNTKIHPEADLVNCVIGDGVKILNPITLTESVAFDDVTIDNNNRISNSIITPERIINFQGDLRDGD
jgi:glucose-1-phosphate thymidylyltransferase